jgi:uncharacterized membrane protein YkgB
MNIKHLSVLFARIALCIIYVWFGALKVIGQSPASNMVKTLLHDTMPFFPFSSFIVLFGLFEIIIGVLFMVPRWEKTALTLFTLHMITTTLPLFVMTQYIWTHLFVPTLEGQYIIKNLALIGCALTVASSLAPSIKNKIDSFQTTSSVESL